MDFNVMARQECPRCGRSNINSFGFESVEDPNGAWAVLYRERGECYDCGCEWSDIYELIRTEVDGEQI